MIGRLLFIRTIVAAYLFMSLYAATICLGMSTDEEYWVKVNPIAKPSAVPSAQYDILASRLASVNNGGLQPIDFFRLLGSDGLSMSDIIAFKEEFLRRKAQELAKTQARPPLEVLPDALEIWDKTFGKSERMLSDVRKQEAPRAFDKAVRRYMEANPNLPYLIRMDVGGWATENFRDGRFEGDIDLTAIASRVENAVQLRDFYNAEIRTIFNMDMAALDAHVTAHRQPTLDVYITQAAARWAEIDAIKRGRLQEIVIENGQVTYRDVTDPMERVFVFANLQNNLQMKEGTSDQLALLMDEPPDKVSADMEPAVSLEMLRHMTTDAINAQLAYHEKLIKLAKYVDRSAGIMKGRSADTAIIAWARQVTSIKQNKGLSALERVKRILAASSNLIGNPMDFAGLDRSITALGDRATSFIRENITRGIDARIKIIDATVSPEEKKSEQEKLLRDLEETYKAYAEKGVDFPPKAHETMLALAEVLKRATQRIPAAEAEKMARMLDMAAEKPASFDLALGIVWEQMGTYYEKANERVDEFNNIIDYLDNKTVARLRALNTELHIGSDTGKFKLTIPLPIGKINDRLNASMLGTVGNTLAFKSFNLGQEGLSYWNAIQSGKDWSESFSNLGTQLFRSRVPGADVVEAVVMENYTRMAVGLVYVMFPTLAVPEALYGVGLAASEWYVGKWQQWQYDEMVDALYKDTVFKQEDGKWRVESIKYVMPNGKNGSVTRVEVFTLPEKLPRISNVLVPQVRNHPSIAMYHELLAKKELSDGQSDIPVWPRKYRNVSLYGEKLWMKYAQEVKKVTRQYFSEVIDELEKRKAFDEGAGEKKLAEIGVELKCGNELQKLVGKERTALETVIADWDAWKKSHTSLMEFRERWKAFFILDRTPSCTPLSIQVTQENDSKDLEEVRKALREATVAVEEIVGRSATDEKTLQPAVRARAGAFIYPSGSLERKKMINEYRAYLDSLRQRAVPPAVRIAGPEVVEEGIPAEFTVVLDRDAVSVRYDWKFASGGEGENLKGAKTARITWIPSAPGKKVLEAFALVDVPGAEWTRATHAVTVLSAEEAPKAKVRLTCPVTSFAAGESVPITAEAVDYGLGGKSFILYLWSVDGVHVGSSVENVFTFDGVGYEGRKVVVTVQARTENNTHVKSSVTLDVLPSGPADGKIRVLIDPEVSEVVYGNVVRFAGIALPKRGGGDLKYQWAVNGEFAGDKATFLFDTAPWNGKAVEISFYAAQMIDGDIILYEGQTTQKVKVVKEVPVLVSIADYPSSVDDSMDLRLCVAEENDEFAYEWVEWNEPGNRWSTSTVGVGRCMLKSARGLVGQVLRFKVTATDGKGRLASAETGSIEVVEPAWSENEEENQGAGNEGQADSGVQSGDDQQKKTIEEPASSTSEQPSAAEKVEQPAPVAEDGEWLKSGLPSGWEVGGNQEKNWSAKMSRVIAEKSKNCVQQTAHGTVTAKIENSFIPRPEEVEKKLRSLVENSGMYPEEESMQAFSLGRFKGKMLTTTLKYKNGFGNPMAGYRGGTAHVHGHVIAIDESARRMISINYSVYGGSCWDNSGKDNAMAQAKAAKAEAMAIIKGLSFHTKKQDSLVQAGTSTPGETTDQDEKKKEYRVTLSRVSPPSGPVVVGSSVKFTAVLSGDTPEGAVKYLFEPHPEVTFMPHETNTGTTSAVFSKPGKVMVWVSAMDATGTIATSEQLEIEVQKPRLELVFEPREPMVGQEVKVKLTVQPEVKVIDFRWLPVPGNAKHSMTSKDGREITFYLRDDKPAEVQVNARVPFSGEDLGEAKASVTAKRYKVVVSPPKAMGPPPKVWKEGKGLVVVEKAIAVDQIVEFSAGIEPPVLSGAVKYQWVARSGPCRVSNPTSSVARVTASEAGSCEIMVTVRDRNDVELGNGTGSFTASVTQESIKQGTKKAKGVDEAKTKVQSAKDKARKGDYDGAIEESAEAVRLDPKNKEAQLLSKKLQKEKEMIHVQIAKAKQRMDENHYAEAQKELIVAKNLNSYYPPIQEAEEELRVRWNAYNQEVNDKLYQVRDASQKKEFGMALEIAAKWRASTTLEEYAENELKRQEQWAQKWKTQKDRQIAMLKDGVLKMKAYDYSGALRRFAEGFLNGNNIYNGTEPEYREAIALQAEAVAKDKRLKELAQMIRVVVEDKGRPRSVTLQALKNVDEAIALQPDNEQFKKWKDLLQQRVEPAEEAAAGKTNSVQSSTQQQATALNGAKQKAAPTVPADSLPGAGSLVGEWRIVSNGYSGKLVILEQNGESFSGRAYPGQPIHESAINGAISGNTITFARTGWKNQPKGLRQDFTGSLGTGKDGKATIEGTFSQNKKGSYRWTATKEGPVQTSSAPSAKKTTSKDAVQSAAPAVQEAASHAAGWKAVSIGNVSFAVPESWTHKTEKDGTVEILHIYWEGDFSSPVYGLSGGISTDYAKAKREMTGGREVQLGGVGVFRVEDGPAINLLFPPMSGNRGVAMVIFRGQKGDQGTIDAILKTITIGR